MAWVSNQRRGFLIGDLGLLIGGLGGGSGGHCWLQLVYVWLGVCGSIDGLVVCVYVCGFVDGLCLCLCVCVCGSMCVVMGLDRLIGASWVSMCAWGFVC